MATSSFEHRHEHLAEAERLLAQVKEGIDYQSQHNLAVTSADVTFYDMRLRMVEMHVQLAKELRG